MTDIPHETIDTITGAWGGDYLPAADNPEVPEVVLGLKAEVAAPAAEDAPKSVDEAAQVGDDLDAAEVDSVTKEPEKEPEKPAEPEEKIDKETRRRLLMIERREQQFRAKEREAKAALESQIQKLEAGYAKLKEMDDRVKGGEVSRKAEYQADPIKLLQDYGLSFAAVAAANLRHHNMPVPPELAAQVERANPPAKAPSLSKDDIAAVVDQKVNQILEKLEAKERAAAEREQQQAVQFETRNRALAVQHVEENPERYPFLSTFASDPDDLAEQMLAARDELFRTTGRPGNIADAAKYIEDRIAGRFHPVLEKLSRSGRKPGQSPQQQNDSGTQSPRVQPKETSSTLSNESGADRVSHTPSSMEEEYEALWERAPAILRGS